MRAALERATALIVCRLVEVNGTFVATMDNQQVADFLKLAKEDGGPLRIVVIRVRAPKHKRSVTFASDNHVVGAQHGRRLPQVNTALEIRTVY